MISAPRYLLFAVLPFIQKKKIFLEVSRTCRFFFSPKYFANTKDASFPLRGCECLQTLESSTIFLNSKQEPEIWERNEVLRSQDPGDNCTYKKTQRMKLSSKATVPNTQKSLLVSQPRRCPMGPSVYEHHCIDVCFQGCRLCSDVQGFPLEKESENFSWKGPDNKCFRLCEPHMVSVTSSLVVYLVVCWVGWLVHWLVVWLVGFITL